jgi:hypothetical protein
MCRKSLSAFIVYSDPTGEQRHSPPVFEPEGCVRHIEPRFCGAYDMLF